jgi:formylmethanofuran dehydrogenase subunit D
MKNFELEQMGVQEMDAVEVKNTDGGGLIVFAFIAGLALAYYEKRIKE